MQVYEELHAQAEAAQRLRTQQVERARYAAELAQRRFLRVDPENRLVADVLEADWNARLLPSNARRLPTWSQISRASGAIPVPPIEIANAWLACCWRM
jgi:hypothetical protein